MNKNSSQTIQRPKVIAIVGPTASGKTSYSIELAKKYDGEIVSADSRLVYKGFNIGTAKPTIGEQSGIPHYMIDIVEPEVDYSAGLYKLEASRIIADIISRNNIPIIVGGTGLYIDILLKNFSLPQIAPDKNLRKYLSNLNNEELYCELIKLDNEAQYIININDRKKVIRAIEIIRATGKTLKESRGIDEPIYDIEWIGKNYDRKTLYNRIDLRVDKMINDGLIEETSYLLKKHGRIPNLIYTIGYKEILKYIDGILSIEEAVDLLKKNTRNYAKRQLTWFRRNPEIKWDIYPEKLDK